MEFLLHVHSHAIRAMSEQNQIMNSLMLRENFHILTIALLNLLLPLSFLLLARISCANYILSLVPTNSISPQNNQIPFIFSFFFYTNKPNLIHALLSILSIATLLHGLSGRNNLTRSALDRVHRPCLYIGWVLLCTLQVCVGLGIEGSISVGIDGSPFDIKKSLLSRIIFFLGLHETMLYWSRAVVRPVVDDTVFGVARGEGLMSRATLAMSLGWLWWWRLRDEFESLVIVPEVKKEMLISIGMADFVGWWLYYLTIMIGMVGMVKSCMWLAMALVCGRVKEDFGDGESYKYEEMV